MRNLSIVAIAIGFISVAQGATPSEPFKLGTFEIDGEAQVGIVLSDCLIVELNAANHALEKSDMYPGDVIINGTSGGVGMGTAVRGEQRWLQPGEEIEATIDGIGTLRMPVVAEEKPEGLTGAQLSPVDSYRK